MISDNTNNDAPATAPREMTEEDRLIAETPLEKCFEELEQIVSALESQSTGLEEAIKIFERGMKLSHRCNLELTRMERRIQLIVENSKGEMAFKDFGNR